VGLLLAAYEMNAFKSDYQKAVISNAKAFARALRIRESWWRRSERWVKETHQVIVRVGYGRGRGSPSNWKKIVSSSTIRGHRMTKPLPRQLSQDGRSGDDRFGMKGEDFAQLAEYMSQVIVKTVPWLKRCLNSEKNSRR